jgi:protein required for attachment to host cells
MSLHKEPLWIAVFDGGRARVFENTGSRRAPDLVMRAEFGIDNPPDRDQARDAPGRLADGAGRSGGAGLPKGVAMGASSIDRASAHDLAETAFVSDFIRHLNAEAEAGRFGELVILAPPRALGVARPVMEPALTGRIIAQEPKDVVRESQSVIAERVGAILFPD